VFEIALELLTTQFDKLASIRDDRHRHATFDVHALFLIADSVSIELAVESLSVCKHSNSTYQIT
jgi:hypothetical protein